MVNDLDYEGIEFPVCKKDYSNIEKKNDICINAFCYANDLIYLVYVLDEKFEKYMDLLLIRNENKSHYVYIKYFNIIIHNKTKNYNKKHFCRHCLHNALAVKQV